MKISRLIALLQEIQEEHGNELEVTLEGDKSPRYSINYNGKEKASELRFLYEI